MKGEHAFDKRLAIAKQLKVGRFVLKIDGDGAVFAGLVWLLCPCVTPRSSGLVQLMRHDGGNTLKFQDDREGLRALPLNSVECGPCRACGSSPSA